MPSISSARELAEKRAAAVGKEVNLADEEYKAKNSVRPIDLILIDKGTIATIPNDYHVYEQPFGERTYLCFISSEGISVPLGIFVRGAKNINDGKYVKPKGTAIDACQQAGTYKEFLDSHKGKKLLFKDFESVTTVFNGNPEPQEVKVWTINFK